MRYLVIRAIFLCPKSSICPLSAPPKPPHHPEIPLANSQIGPCNVWEKRICFTKPIVQQIMSSAKLKRRFTTTMRVISPASPILKSQLYHQCLLPKSATHTNTRPSTQIGSVALAGKQLPLSISILAVALTTNPANGLVPHFRPSTNAWLCCYVC